MDKLIALTGMLGIFYVLCIESINLLNLKTVNFETTDIKNSRPGSTPLRYRARGAKRKNEASCSGRSVAVNLQIRSKKNGPPSALRLKNYRLSKAA